MKKSASPWVYATLFAYTSSQINRGYILIMIKATLKIDKKIKCDKICDFRI